MPRPSTMEMSTERYSNGLIGSRLLLCRGVGRANESKLRPRFGVRPLELGDVVSRAHTVLHRANALARAPDILPRFWFAAAVGGEVHGRLVAIRQVVGIHARLCDRRCEVVA